MAFPIGSNSLYCCFLCPEHGTDPLPTVVIVYFKHDTINTARIVKDSRRSSCPGKSRDSICRSVYGSQNTENDSSMKIPHFAAKSVLVTELLRKVMLYVCWLVRLYHKEN
jgi:hypothetical protein